jgi:hypothetical protein
MTDSSLSEKLLLSTHIIKPQSAFPGIYMMQHYCHEWQRANSDCQQICVEYFMKRERKLDM